jgi:hypothetical protein
MSPLYLQVLSALVQELTQETAYSLCESYGTG